MSLANDQTVLVRALAKPAPVALPPLPTFVQGGIAWRSDDTIVTPGGVGLYLWNRERELVKVTVQGGSTGHIAGTDHLIVWNSDGVQELRIDGTRGGWIAQLRLPSSIRALRLDPARRFLLVDAGQPTPLRLYDVASGRPVVEVDTTDRLLYATALLAGETPVVVVVDSKLNVFAIERGATIPLASFSTAPMAGITRVLAAPPVGHRVALGVGREVVVIDVAARRELLRGELGSAVTAIAWSPRGDRVAAAGETTEIRVFDVR